MVGRSGRSLLTDVSTDNRRDLPWRTPKVDGAWEEAVRIHGLRLGRNSLAGQEHGHTRGLRQHGLKRAEVAEVHVGIGIQVDPQTGLMSGSAGPRLKQYRHDALGRRVRTTDPSGVTRHVCGSGAEVLAKYAVGGTTETILREFVWGGPGAPGFPDPPVLVNYTGAGGGAFGAAQRFYFLKDVQGSVGALTNAVGQVIERYFYTPYGETPLTAASIYTRFEGTVATLRRPRWGRNDIRDGHLLRKQVPVAWH